MLQLKNVTKEYDGVKILKDINITFPNKGLITILGKSGSGKSTLLNLIGALDTCTSGEIFFNNKNLDKINKEEYYRQCVGFIFQNYNLINSLNAKENIEIVEKINSKEIIDTLSLNNVINNKVSKLSGGEKQKVAIARALISNKKIILADEPTGALDSKNSIIVMDILKKVSKNILVILVTHNEILAKKYSDHIIYIEDGKIKNNLKVKENIENYNVKKNKNKNINIYKIILNNIRIKKKRVLGTIIAFSIGIISLLLVLGISTGFKKSINEADKNTLSKYPIYISKTSTNLDINLKQEKNNNSNIIKTIDENHINKIDKNYLDFLNGINNYINYKLYTYQDNDLYFYKYNNKINKEVKLIKGTVPSNNEIILIVKKDNSIDKSILNSINLNKNNYEYDELIGKKYKSYVISGIGYFKNDTPLYETTGLFINTTNYDNNIPYEIYLYPKNYQNKLKLKKYLNQNKNVLYTDYSSTVKSVSETLLNGVSVVLICFCMLSLLIATIMIGIITYINVIERIHEIGLYKSLGFKKSDIKEIFIKENEIIAIVSVILSIIICLLIGIPINNLFYKYISLKNVYVLDIKNILLVLEISIVLSFIGSYLPIKKVNKINIIDALRYD